MPVIHQIVQDKHHEDRKDLIVWRLKSPAPALLPLLTLSACMTTSIVDSENPSKNRPPAWADYWTLSVDTYGTIAGVPDAQLAGDFPSNKGSIRRILLYLNPAQKPRENNMCTPSVGFSAGNQTGRYAYVVGALCNGNSVVTYATANILASGITPHQVAGHLQMIRTQLYQALTPGNNHPERLYSGQMYGP